MSHKKYDQAYFDRWYRGPDPPVGDATDLGRAVTLAVAAAESVLARPVKSVLDVGCGEGRWQPVLMEIREDAAYLGIDASEYAVQRFGDSRNIRHGRFADLAYHVFDEAFDLVICSDVLHYLTDEEILQGIDPLAERTGGVAVIDIFTAEDDPEGDRVDFHLRPAAWYRTILRDAGLVPIGLQMYVHVEVADMLEALDLPEID
ncbi:MAG: methyltransferase domain-containing protein [Gemmatimonadetes bacterium]|nr:methyltransferase domain-containing protein [Gemmatimonadota bacterium]